MISSEGGGAGLGRRLIPGDSLRVAHAETTTPHNRMCKGLFSTSDSDPGQQLHLKVAALAPVTGISRSKSGLSGTAECKA